MCAAPTPHAPRLTHTAHRTLHTAACNAHELTAHATQRMSARVHHLRRKPAVRVDTRADRRVQSRIAFPAPTVHTHTHTHTHIHIHAHHTQIRALLGAKYGAAFVHKADTNADNAVNEKLVARLSLSVPQATVIEMYLQDICASQGIPYNTDVPMPMLSVPAMPMQPMQPMSLSPMPSPQPMQPMQPMEPMQSMQPMGQPQPMAQAPQMPPSAPQDADAFPHPPAAPHGGAPGDDIDELMARLNALKK